MPVRPLTKNLLRRLWPGRTAPAFDPIAVDCACFVIGDIHGCADLLELLLDRAPAGAELICLGDYVDRGDDSAGVLRLLSARPDITCLLGNHEAMMLDFLDQPDPRTARWLRYGGLQTLASFGVKGGVETQDQTLLTRLRDDLASAMGDDLIAWVRALPLHLQRGNVAIVHAAADPAVPLEAQDDKTLIWGHPDFGRIARRDGQWVVHGHTIVNVPEQRGGVISIDTGAYATGRLTAAHLSDGACAFIGVDWSMRD